MAKRFAVALTFPEEQRRCVGLVANSLAKILTRERVLYDEYFAAELARPNLDTYLQNLYHDQTELVVVFLSKIYDQKQWCGLEFRSIRDLIKQQRDDQIMFVRMGEGDVKGTFGIDGYLDATDLKPQEISKLILQRHKQMHLRLQSASIPETPTGSSPDHATNADELRHDAQDSDVRTPETKNAFSASLNEQHPKTILPLHGIRTHGSWVEVASNTLGEDSNVFGKGWTLRLEDWRYGWFNLFQFLSPFSRTARVYWFRKRYTNEVSDSQNRFASGPNGKYPSVIAHSFGTYIIGNALLRFPTIRLNRVILVGSILPRDFPWKALIDRGQVQAVRNEHGLHDTWTVISSWVIPGTGASGTIGFSKLNFPENDLRLEQEAFEGYRHSDYFERLHIKEYWRPFLEKALNATSPPSSTAREEAVPVLGRGDHHRIQLLASIVIMSLLIAALYYCAHSIGTNLSRLNSSSPIAAKVSVSEFRKLANDFYVEEHWKNVDSKFLKPTNAGDAVHTVWENVSVSLPSKGTPTRISDMYVSALQHGTDYLEPILCGEQVDAGKLQAESVGPSGLSLYEWMRQVEESQLDLGIPFGKRDCNWWLLFLALDTEISVEISRDTKPIKLNSGQELTPDLVIDVLHGKLRLEAVDLAAVNLRFRNQLSAFQDRVQSIELHSAWYQENRDRIKSTHRQISSKYADKLSEEYARYLGDPTRYSMSNDHNVIANYLKAEVAQRFAIVIPGKLATKHIGETLKSSIDVAGKTAPSASKLEGLVKLCDTSGWNCDVDDQDGIQIVRIEPSPDRPTTAWTEILQSLATVDAPIELKLTAFPPEEYSLGSVWKLKTLTELELTLNHSLITPEKLGELNELQTLILKDCDHVAEFWDTEQLMPPVVLKNLRFLSLDGSANWIANMRDLACFPNLVELDLSNRRGDFSLKGLDLLTELKHLALIGVGEITALDELDGATGLQRLRCQTSSFSGGNLPQVKGFELRKIDRNVEYFRPEAIDPVNRANE